jgi:hypothetical protein
MFTGTTAFLRARHTRTSPLLATEPGIGRLPTARGTEIVIGTKIETALGTEIMIGTTIETAIGTAIAIEITMTEDCIADGTNTIAITTTTGTGIMTGVATAITIATMIMTATMTKITTTIANWKPVRSSSR